MHKNKILANNSENIFNIIHILLYHVTLLMLIILLSIINSYAKQKNQGKPQQLSISRSLKTELAARYPGYQIPPASKFSSLVADAMTNDNHSFQPAVIWGDWNGDEQTDLALLLIKKNKNEEDLVVLACHNKKQGQYQIIELDHVIRPKILGVNKLLDFLRVAPPGKKEVYDQAKRDFITIKLSYHTIERGILEKDSTLYKWTGKTYKQYFTSFP